MTEAEWLSGADVGAVNRLIGLGSTDGRFQLLACACCRHAWHLLTEESSRQAVELAERFADGRETRERVDALLLSHADRPLTANDQLSVARSALIPNRSVTRAVPSLVASF